MDSLAKSTNYVLLCLLGILCTLQTSFTFASNLFELDWSTPPPLVVVADIDKVYHIGCRVTLNTTLGSQYPNLNLDNVKLWAVISKVCYFAV